MLTHDCTLHLVLLNFPPTHLAPDTCPPRFLTHSIHLLSISLSKGLYSISPYEGSQDGEVADERGVTDGMSSSSGGQGGHCSIAWGAIKGFPVLCLNALSSR